MRKRRAHEEPGDHPAMMGGGLWKPRPDLSMRADAHVMAVLA